jgi:hypothetical protein
MNKINIKLFKKSKDKNLYHLTDANNKDIYLKFHNIRLPFNLQYYNNKLYINFEIFPLDDKYDDNITLINKFEDCIKENMVDNKESKESKESKEFCSVIKDRERGKHIKCMLKRDSKDILLDGNDLDIKRLSEYHKLGYRYDIVIKVEILWETEEMYGVIFYMHTILQT